MICDVFGHLWHLIVPSNFCRQAYNQPRPIVVSFFLDFWAKVKVEISKFMYCFLPTIKECNINYAYCCLADFLFNANLNIQPKLDKDFGHRQHYSLLLIKVVNKSFQVVIICNVDGYLVFDYFGQLQRLLLLNNRVVKCKTTAVVPFWAKLCAEDSFWPIVFWSKTKSHKVHDI